MKEQQLIAGADEQKIRELLENYAEATREGRRDDILANHAADVLVFDPLPPLQHEGATAYRKSWDEWWPETSGPGLFDLRDLRITAGQDIAFAHALIDCGGTHPDGSTFRDTVRATYCLRRFDGRWLITHQHVSMPVSVDRDES